MEEPRKRRFGVHRWFVLLFIVLGFFAAQAYAPILPHIQVAPEPYNPEATGFRWTNTLTATVLADIILLLLALAVRRAATSGNLVPKGISGAIEAILEVIHNLTESTAGRWTKTIFPFFATITLLVLVVNWMELIPGVDSIGFLHHVEEGGYPVKELIPGVVTIVQPSDAGEAGGAAEGAGYHIIPFVRVASTDLNFTLALAIISVVMTQVIGLRALGAPYLTKYFNVKTFFSRPMFGVIDFGVGILELVSEFSKLLSFTFRLFGNIFAGSVLLFVIGTLVPVFAQSVFLMLEFFVGLIQAVVFGMLTMVFMAQATQGHGEHAEHQDEHQGEMPVEAATV